MNVMRTAARSRKPVYPPGIPAKEAASFERHWSYVFERRDGGDNATAWGHRVKEHMTKRGGSAATIASPEPHSCTHCQKLVIDISQPVTFNPSGNAIHGKFCNMQCSLQDVRDGAEDGCEFFLQLLSQWDPQDLTEADEPYYHVFAYGHVRSEDAEYDLLVVANIGMIDARKGWSKWENANHSDNQAPLASMTVYTESGNPASQFIRNRPISVDPWSSQTVNMARSSLANCVQHSEAIEKEAMQFSVAEAPARLLTISKAGAEWSLRLEQVDVAVPRYCTLSYCWGQIQKGFTTLENVEERGLHLEFDAISRTIQDAIVVSWDLGLRHIWVDALCIIQDSESDKAVEISKMSHIFTNAYITICTSRTLFADEGFLLPRDPFRVDSSMFRLAFQLPHQEQRGSLVLYQPSNYSRDNRLKTRAWGFQERMLSRRILDFDGTTTEYSCCHIDRSQSHGYCDGGPSSNARDWHQIDWYRRLFVTFDSIDDDRMAYKDVNDLWSGVIREYTGRSVTNATDRALAIAAIAERFAKYTKDEYLGGLWKRTLPWSMMWCMRMRAVRLPRPERTPAAYQGPSWSWLGVNGPVHFFHAKELLDENAKVVVKPLVLEADLRYDTVPYGAVKSASIALEGRIRRARWIRNDDPSTTTAEDYDFLAIHELDQPEWSKKLESDTSGKKDNHGRSYSSEDLIPARMLPDALEPEFALPVSSGGSAYLDVILLQMFKHNGVPIGLALRDPGKDNEGFYERLGIFHLEEGQHLRYNDGKAEDVVVNGTVRGSIIVRDAAKKKQRDQNNEDMDKDFQRLLSRGWERAKATDSQADMVRLDDMKAHLERIGNVLEGEIQKKTQDTREKQLWEKWKGWFDEEDNEDRVLVLI